MKILIPLSERDFTDEFVFSASRSSSAGGQHVNKVSSRIELRFSIQGSKWLNEAEKETLHHKLKNRINSEGQLILTCQESRSQIANKQLVIQKFYDLISTCLKPVKNRTKTKPTRISKLKRLESKRKIAEKKLMRKRDF
jgi:ribosome-associated protein